MNSIGLRESSISVDDAYWMFPDQHTSSRPFEEAGIVQYGNQTLCIGNPPFSSTYLENQSKEALLLDNAIPLIGSISTGSATGSQQARQVGLEAELNIVSFDGSSLDLYPDDEELFPALVNHAELWRNLLEVNAKSETSTVLAYNELTQAIAKVCLELFNSGALVDPASARMQDTPSFIDITPNGRIAMLFDTHMKAIGKNALQFTGVGVHEHYDVGLDNAPMISHYLRLVAPFLNIGLHAAPFAFGENTPHMGEALDVDLLRAYDGQLLSSTRYLTRTYASRSGGVGERVAYQDLADTLRSIDNHLRDGRINHPARIFGDHADVRLRLDASDYDKYDQPARLELCVKDTSALRFSTLQAYSELTYAVICQLEERIAEGDKGVERLHQEFPALFGDIPELQSHSNNTELERTHQNSIELAYGGPEADIISGTGKSVKASSALWELVRFASQEKHRLSRGTMAVLRDSVMDSSSVRNLMRQYKDEQGLPSLHGYYQTGCGTPSQWMRERATAASKIGIRDEGEIVQDGTLDRTSSFLTYIRRQAIIAGN